MKIIVRDLEEKRRIKLTIPLFMFKIILPFLKIEELEPIKPYFKDFCKIIKRYVKENGHFKLLDVISNDAIVKIIV